MSEKYTWRPKGEYIVRYHGKYKADGAKQSWWSETPADDAGLETTLSDIEEHVDGDWELEAVMLASFSDGAWTACDVTQTILALLYDRETARLTEQFQRGETNFYYLAGHLEMADRKFEKPKFMQAAE